MKKLEGSQMKDRVIRITTTDGSGRIYESDGTGGARFVGMSWDIKRAKLNLAQKRERKR